MGRGVQEGVGKAKVSKAQGKGGLLTHLGLQHLQSLRQLRHFAAVETTCGEGKAGLRLEV